MTVENNASLINITVGYCELLLLKYQLLFCACYYFIVTHVITLMSSWIADTIQSVGSG